MRIVFASEYPAGHVLRFNDEDAKFGHNNMIDLRRAVFSGKDDVAEELVDVAVQKQPHTE